MKVKTLIKYEEGYIPPRCRKVRYKECEEYIYSTVREVAPADMQLAFEDNSYSGKGKIYFYKGKLWSKVKPRELMCNPQEHNIKTPIGELIWCREHSSVFFPRSWRDGEHPDRKRMMSAVRKANNQYIIIDNELFKETAEPRYVVNTFGLGHNHGGTGLFVEYHYNPNISKNNYFSALEGDMAVTYANNIAAGRGDTKDVGKFEKMIVVHMPEIVKVKPQEQHGNGNKILNDLNDIVNGTSDKLTAGLLCMAYVANNK